MVDFLAVLLIPVIIAGVWYGVAARSRRLDAEALVAARDREIAQLLDKSSEPSAHVDDVNTEEPAAFSFTDPLTSLGTTVVGEGPRDLRGPSRAVRTEAVASR
jgi:hypothetical protein